MFIFLYQCYVGIFYVKWYINGLSTKLEYGILSLKKVGDLMASKKRKYTVKTKSRMFVIFIFFVAIISTLGYTLFFNICQIIDLKLEMADLKEEKTVLEDEEKVIQADIKRLQDSEYIARYAREKYFYSKEGELILRIKD